MTNSRGDEDSSMSDATEAARAGMATAFHAGESPDRMAIWSEYGERTFGELNARANQLVRYLRKAGLEDGDAVALLSCNRPEFLEVLSATLRAGFRLTPINWHLTGDNVGYIVDNCDAKAFIADARFSGTAAEAHSASDRLEAALAFGGEIEGFESYESSLDPMDSSDIEDPVLGSSMLYTSGTTGRPKGVYRKARNAVLPNDGMVQPFGDDAVALCTGPAYHAAPLLIDIVRPHVSGVPIVMMDKWDAERTLQLIDQHKVTHCHMVATMFHRLLQLPQDVKDRHDTSSMRQIVHGAAPCPVHVKQSMIEWLGPIIIEYYAATEGGGGFLISSEEWLKKPGSVGRDLPEFENRILDDDGNEVGVGEVGTIYMKAPETGAFEYYKDRDKTEGSYRGSHFTLGDMGYIDEDGYLFLTGRTAELIISGGVNIYPQEVDNEVMQHGAVLDVCTIGVPNEEWGEEVKTVVELRPGHQPSDELAQEILDFARERLPGFKAPRSIEFSDELPRLPSGKIQRRLVRDPFWEGRDKKI
jgi:long-chain acyl-CoA synthetase